MATLERLAKFADVLTVNTVSLSWPAMMSYVVVVEIDLPAPESHPVTYEVAEALSLPQLTDPASLMLADGYEPTPLSDAVTVVASHQRVELELEDGRVAVQSNDMWRRGMRAQGELGPSTVSRRALVAVVPGKLDEDTLNQLITSGLVYGGAVPVRIER